jgi:hypothetical protein
MGLIHLTSHEMSFRVFLDFHEFLQNNSFSVSCTAQWGALQSDVFSKYKVHYGEVKIQRVAKESAWNKCTMHKTLTVGIFERIRQL